MLSIKYFDINYPLWGGNSIINGFVTGGWGPGSYYYPVLIQILLIFPFIYQLTYKFDKYGVLATFLGTIFFETFKYAYYITEDAQYRLIAFRYIFVLSYGVYLFKHKKDSVMPWRYWLYMVIGITFNIITQYNGYIPPIFTLWTSTSVISCLMIMPLMYKLTHIKLSNKFGKLFNSIELIGKNTYCIFLFQMLFYCFWAKTIIYTKISSRLIQLIICIVINILGGYLLHWIEKGVVILIYKCVIYITTAILFCNSKK